MHLIERIPRTYRHKSGTVEFIGIAGVVYNVWRADDSFIGSVQTLKEAAELIEMEASYDR